MTDKLTFICLSVSQFRGKFSEHYTSRFGSQRRSGGSGVARCRMRDYGTRPAATSRRRVAKSASPRPSLPDGGLYGNWNLLGSPRFEDFDAPLLASAATLSSYKASAEKGVSGFTNTAMVTLPEMHEGGASSPSEGPQEGVKRPKKDHKGAPVVPDPFHGGWRGRCLFEPRRLHVLAHSASPQNPTSATTI
jgi:hypothetical protein